MNVVCFRVDVSAAGRSLVQGIPIGYACVTECNQVQQ